MNNDPCPGSCGRTDTRPYAEGPRCPEHTPAMRRGHPEPDSARYCAPLRCYCGGDDCTATTAPLEPIITTVVDLNAIRTGKRRSSLAEYRSAQANTTGGAA